MSNTGTEQEPKRIMMLYSERSGSNLLRVLLGNHSCLSAPVPPHILDAFIDHVAHFGDLEKPDNMIAYLAGLRRYVNHPFSDWKLELTGEEIFERYKPSSFIQAFDAVYRAKSAEDGCRYYVCKDNHLFNYAYPIRSELSNVLFVYLYRDPRDVVSSWMKNKMLFYLPADAAWSWKKEQRICIEMDKVFDIDLLHVRYEDLIKDTPAVMDRLLKQTGLNVEEECYYNRKKRPEASRNVLWKNIDKPVMSNNSKKYRELLSDKELKIVESIVCEEMTYLGYESETSCDWEDSYFDQIINKIRRSYRKRKSRPQRRETQKLIQDREKLKRKIIKEVL